MRKTVLLVDDVPAVTAALRRRLRAEPFRMLEARSATEALDIVANDDVDVVVTDEQMPEMTGSELLARLARVRPRIVGFILTGEPTVRGALRAVNEGRVYRILTKPCRPEELAAGIRQALAEQDARAAIDAVPSAEVPRPERGAADGDLLERLVRERTTVLEAENARLRADVAARLRADEALRRHAERLRVALRSSGVAVANQDLELRYTWVHDPRMGLLADDMIGSTDAEVFGAEAGAILTTIKRRVIESGSGTRCDVALALKGEQVHQHLAVEPLRDSRGRLSGITCASIDVTQQKRVEASLWASEARFRTLVESMEDVVFATDRDLRFVEMFGRWDEASWVENTGWSRRQLLGKTVADAFGAEAPRHEQMYRRALAGEHVVYEWSALRDGAHRYFQTSLSPIRDHAGRVEGLVGLGRDMTDRKVMESQLLQAQKLESIGQLAAGIAHEINTPVQFVGDNLHFLEESFGAFGGAVRRARGGGGQATPAAPAAATAKLPDDDELDYLLSEVPTAISQSLEGVARVARIVRAMKAFSHPDTGELADVDINAALETTLTVARNEWKYVAELETDFDSTLPPVCCLGGEMNQVFLNILVNAAHAIEEAGGAGAAQKGRIGVSTRRLGDDVEIRISDSGTGIPEAVRARVFDPFFTTKPVGKGTGQGLMIAHAVVVGKHQGSLTFETETGRGTTFVIRLPLAGPTLPA